MTAAADPGGVVPLFATPFAAANTGADLDFNARLASVCESQRAAAEHSADSPRDPLHFRGREDFLDSTDTTASELKRLILGRATTIVAGLSDIDGAAFARLHIQARGWCSIVQPDGHVPAQHFPGAGWLAVYCAQAAESAAGVRGAGVLRLYERRLESIYRDASSWELKAPYRYGNHTWTPRPGWMALFPAHVRHEVSVVRAAAPLIVVFAMIRFIDADARDSRYG
jgi:hypothetical protein